MQTDPALTQQTITLVQLTDAHLGQTVGERLLGMDTDLSLQYVIELLQREQSAPDVLLATGDLSNHGAEASYRRFDEYTRDLAQQTLWLPGNHDDPLSMAAALCDGEPLPRTLLIGGWKIIMLDSRIPGAVGGRLSPSELALLEAELENAADKHVLVCLHHHPIDIDCAWLDQQRVTNGAEFLALLQRFPQVKGVLWGHIHQQLDLDYQGLKLMATPSTCIQFMPRQVGFRLDTLNPGYRWLRLQANGDIDTGVSRIQQHFHIDYDYVGGYD